MILISPTEHQLITHLPSATVSPLCELNGADVITRTKLGMVGFQRKTIPDLDASLKDGRLAKELLQLTSSSLLSHRFLIVETTRLTTSGTFMNTDMSLEAYTSILTKFHLLNIPSYTSTCVANTASIILQSTAYMDKGSPQSVRRNTSQTDAWGRSGNKNFASYLLQSFPGVGPKLATAIANHFDNLLPLQWMIPRATLTLIPGVGKSLSEKIYAYFYPAEELEENEDIE